MKFIRIVIFSLAILSLGSCGSRKMGNDAMLAQDIGEYYKAIEKYRKATRKEKDRVKRMEYTFALAECYRYIGNYELAELYYRNAIRRGYTNPIALFYSAEMLRATQKYDESAEDYQAYLDSVPGDERALAGLEAIRLSKEWMAKPTRHIINPVKELNSRESDFSPVFVGGRDNEIIFTSTRKASTGKKQSMVTGQSFADIYRATFGIQRQKWEEPKLLEEYLIINTGDEEGAVSMSSTGEQMIFTRSRYDKTKPMGTELYSTSQSRGNWSQPIKLQLVGDSIIAAHPALSPDESVLYFVSDMPGGLGGKDIWKAEKQGNSWGKPMNLGSPVNTPGDEMFPFVRDNGELYFSSNYHPGMGGFDIFVATKKENDEWDVKNMGYPMNSPGDDFGIAFVRGENKGMFSSNRKGSRSDDIYSFVVPPKIFQASGQVFDKETNSVVDGVTVRIIGTDGTNLRMRTQNGKFQLKLQPETEYIFAAFKDGYLRDKAEASTLALEESKDFNFDFFLTPTDAPINIDNIIYAFGSWELMPESRTSLDSLVQILLFNPTITIELMAHTDHVGTEQYNFELSQKRAQSVVDYLVEKGISPQRLFAKGYGETWPKTVTREIAQQYNFLRRNDELTEAYLNTLSPEQREIAQSLNRRTEFRVLSYDFIERFDAEPER